MSPVHVIRWRTGARRWRWSVPDIGQYGVAFTRWGATRAGTRAWTAHVTATCRAHTARTSRRATRPAARPTRPTNQTHWGDHA